MPFKEYDEFAAGPLRFPIRGKTYEVPEVTFEAGILLQKVESGNAPDIDAEAQWRLLMGPAYDELKADNVPIEAINRVILACLTDYRLGRAMAEQVWEAGVDPEAFAPKGADTEGTDSTSTGGESSTQKRASTTGTTSPKVSTKKKAPKAARPPKSSSTGT